MIDYIVSNLWIFWAIIIFSCLILELSSGDFFITCLAIGALFSLGSSFFLPFWAQISIGAVCSVLSIWFIRPKILHRFHAYGENRLSNADALIGRIGIVIEAIPAGGSGYVKVDGDEWKAVSQVPQEIKKGNKVEIIGRDSIIVTVKLI